MAPTTMAPTTRAPTTMAPTTMAPTTMAPTTMAPTTIDASLYEMYGGPIGPNGNGVIDIDKVVFVPLINQYVFVAKDSSYLKIVSQDNLQARYTTDTVFDPAKWNNGYNVQQPGLYNIRPKASRFEMYGPYIGTAKTVSKVVFVPSLNQYVFMIGDDGWLKMVRQDNLENRYTAGENTVFDPSKWNNGYNVGSVGGYNVRVKCNLDCNAVQSKAKTYYDTIGEWKNVYTMIPNRVNKVNDTQCDILYTYNQIGGSGSGQDKRRFTFNNDANCNWNVTAMGAYQSGTTI